MDIYAQMVWLQTFFDIYVKLSNKAKNEKTYYKYVFRKY